MKRKTKHLTLLLMLAMLITLMLPTSAFAASKPKAAKKQACYNFTWGDAIAISGLKKGDKITNVKSSNKKVMTAKAEKGTDGLYYVRVFPKAVKKSSPIAKTGKSTISFTIKRGKTSWKYSVVYTSYKYSNPIKSLKIGSTNYTSKFKTASSYFVQKNISGKLTVTAKSGWKVTDIKKAKFDTNVFEYKKIATVKNNGKVTLTDGQALIITLTNSKTGAIEEIQIEK